MVVSTVIQGISLMLMMRLDKETFVSPYLCVCSTAVRIPRFDGIPIGQKFKTPVGCYETKAFAETHHLILPRHRQVSTGVSARRLTDLCDCYDPQPHKSGIGGVSNREHPKLSYCKGFGSAA